MNPEFRIISESYIVIFSFTFFSGGNGRGGKLIVCAIRNLISDCTVFAYSCVGIRVSDGKKINATNSTVGRDRRRKKNCPENSIFCH